MSGKKGGINVKTHSLGGESGRLLVQGGGGGGGDGGWNSKTLDQGGKCDWEQEEVNPNKGLGGGTKTCQKKIAKGAGQKRGSEI